MTDKLKKLLHKIKNAFCYCGLEKTDYNKIKRQAYVANFKMWRWLHVIGLILSIGLYISSYAGNFISVSRTYALVLMLYFLVCVILFSHVFREDSLVAQFVIYLSMILILLYGYFQALGRPTLPATNFEVILIVFSVFMIDKPYYMALLLVSSTVIYLAGARQVKPPDVYQTDLMNTWLYCILSFSINVFYNNIRLREIKLANDAKEHLLRLKKANSYTRELNRTLRGMTENIVEILGEVVESRDSESGAHIQRVKGFTNILAKQIRNDCPEYGLDDYRINLMTFASALHDVGKIAIPDAILLKPAKLTDEEFEVMKSHCERGCEIVSKMKNAWSKDYLDMGLSICLNHHEKWDGKGYPRGLKEDEIPIEAQIVSIADCYDALTNKRVYKEAYTFQKAFDMIMNGECGAFSPKILSCFEKSKRAFEAHAIDPSAMQFDDLQYEVNMSEQNGKIAYVVGLRDTDDIYSEGK